jgi:hypothetical protein
MPPRTGHRSADRRAPHEELTMPIRFSTAPDEAERLARAAVHEVADTAPWRAAATGPDTVALTTPHVVHGIGLDALAARQPLTGAAPVAWQFLVETPTGPVASTEVALDATGEPTAFTQLNEGPFVQATTAALDTARRVPEVVRGDYELRVLRIPALYLVALWLKDRGGTEDLFLPLDPAPEFIEAGRPYRGDELLDALAGPARSRLAVDRPPPT